MQWTFSCKSLLIQSFKFLQIDILLLFSLSMKGQNTRVWVNNNNY